MGSFRELLIKFRTKATYKYLVAITFGVSFGIVLNVARANNTVTTLLTIPGPAFLRALQCAVIPMM